MSQVYEKSLCECRRKMNKSQLRSSVADNGKAKKKKEEKKKIFESFPERSETFYQNKLEFFWNENIYYMM